MEEKFDGIFLEIAKQHSGIDGILDTFFSFLRRKTDFFTGASEETVMKVINTSVKKHSQLAEKDRARISKEKEERLRQDQIRAEKERQLKAEREKEEPKIIELDENDNEILPQATTTNKVEDEKKIEEVNDEDKKDDKDKGFPPNKGNGYTTNLYHWTQTLKELALTVKLSAGTKSKDLTVKIKSETLYVSLKGQSPILEGKFPHRILTDESLWSVADEGDHRILNIELLKENQMEWWNTILIGQPEINLSNINPETSNLSDLDGEMRSTVEKMMYDQRQKEMGLPTSDDQKKQDMLKKFMSQHPEMDFSKAKIN